MQSDVFEKSLFRNTYTRTRIQYIPIQPQYIHYIIIHTYTGNTRNADAYIPCNTCKYMHIQDIHTITCRYNHLYVFTTFMCIVFACIACIGMNAIWTISSEFVADADSDTGAAASQVNYRSRTRKAKAPGTESTRDRAEAPGTWPSQPNSTVQRNVIVAPPLTPRDRAESAE